MALRGAGAITISRTIKELVVSFLVEVHILLRESPAPRAWHCAYAAKMTLGEAG